MPVNNFSVMTEGRHCFLGFKQYSDELIMCLKDKTWCCQWGSNPEPLDCCNPLLFTWAAIYYSRLRCHDIPNLGRSPKKWRRDPDMTIAFD